MLKNNILNHYNEDTELSTCEASFEQEDEARSEKSLLKDKEKYNLIIKRILIPNISKINFNRDILLYITLGLFFIISLISTFFKSGITDIIGVLFLTYITIQVTTRICELPNTRYTNIATWNLYNSLKMIFKSICPEILKNLNHITILSISNITFIISLILSIIPSFSYTSCISLIIIMISYLLSFYNQDFGSIKESVKYLNSITPILLIITAIIGSLFNGSIALNLTGYVAWLVIYYIYNLVKDYEFVEM